MSVSFVFRGPLISPVQGPSYQPSWMVRPIGTTPSAVISAPLQAHLNEVFQPLYWQSSQMLRLPFATPSTTPTVVNLYYKPMQPTVGHLGFLGMY